MRNTLKFISILLGTIILLSCSNESEYTFGFQDSLLAKETMIELTKQGIWFREEDGEKITIKQSDLEMVINISEKIFNKIIPDDRSFSVNRYIQPKYLKLLDEAGVSYKVISFGDNYVPSDADTTGDNSEWIVFDKGHEGRGYAIWEELSNDASLNDYFPPSE